MSSTTSAPALLLIGALATAIIFLIGSKGAETYQNQRIRIIDGDIADNEDGKCVKIQYPSEVDEKLRHFFVKQSAARQKLLGSFLDPKTADSSYGPYYNALVAEIVCPWLARVGNVNDGGKWTCNPWALPENCVIYSLGVGPDITFEFEMDEVAEKRCKIYSFDPNPALGQALVEKKSERFIFTPLKITPNTNDMLKERSVKDIMKNFNHTFVDFLKIDIEGSEYGVLPALLTNTSNPIACQIFIEMHGTPHQCATLLSQFAKGGFWMFFYERNGYYPTGSEYSFLHESCFERYGVKNKLVRNFPFR